MSALQKIKSAGFDVNLQGDSFAITPSSLLNSQQREFLKTHKAEIISELQAEALAVQPTKQIPVTCGQCQHFKCYNTHGKGAGRCLAGGAYGAWSETTHHCTNFNGYALLSY